MAMTKLENIMKIKWLRGICALEHEYELVCYRGSYP